MTTAADFEKVPAFEIHSTREQRFAFVFNSPHSGRHYPARFLAMTRLDAMAVRRSEDCFVDELFAGAVAFGAPMLTANFPRAYLDVNREPWELDPRMFADPLPAFANIRSPRVAGGLGTVPRLVGEGLDIYAGRLPVAEAIARIETVYKPYHACLTELVTRTHTAFGHAILIDCHSMPAGIRVGESGMRPDFIVGDRFGASAAGVLTEQAIGLLSGMGYTVAHNKPYAGGFITEHYGRPAHGLHALQIEVNRGLYMDERTLKKTGGFDSLADDMGRFVRDLLSIVSQIFPAMPLAAE